MIETEGVSLGLQLLVEVVVVELHALRASYLLLLVILKQFFLVGGFVIATHFFAVHPANLAVEGPFNRLWRIR